MAKSIRIDRAHGLGREAALHRLGELAADVQRKYGVNVTQAGDVARVSGKGVSGQVQVDEKRISVDLSLGMPASLIAGKIEQGITKALDEHFKA